MGTSDTMSEMRHLGWRFYWASDWFRYPGLHFWAGMRFRTVRLWGTDFALQVVIVLLTVPGMWLAGGNGASVKWGFALLVISQPLWLIAAWRARLFGMFLMALIYSAIWVRAVINSF
jgi:hypothetical protein